FASATLLPHQLISGRGKPPYQGPSCNSARAQGSKEGWDHSVPRRLSAMLDSDHTSNLGMGIGYSFLHLLRRSSFHLQNCAFRRQAVLEIAPERDQQLACDGDDRNPPDTALEFANTFAEPDTQGAVRLMPQPQPCELNHHGASLGVTSLADTLITAHRAALKMRRRQTDVARQLFAIVKRAVEHFADKCRRKFGPEALNFGQILDLLWARMLCLLSLGRCNGIALRLDRLDHSDDKLQSLQFAQDFRQEPRRQRPIISGAQPFQLLHPIATQGLVVIDAMDREQSLDPVDVLDAFADQPVTLTMEPTVVLFGDTGHAHNAPNLRFTPQIRHQGSQQSLGIDAVSLRTTRPTINLQTCRVDHVVTNAVCFEQAVEPEAVVASFVARNDFHGLLHFSGNSRPDPLAQI